MVQGQIYKGAIVSYISLFLNIVISLVYTPWIIKQIGVSDYGLYSLVTAFLTYFLLDFGLSGTITRFIAKYRAEGDEVRVANMMGITARVYFVFDVIIFLILFILYFFLTDIFVGLTSEEIEKLKILYCCAGGFSVLSFLLKPISGAMMAYEYFVENKVLDMLVRLGTVICVVIALLLNGNVYHLVFLTGFVGFVISVIRYIVFCKKSKLKINWGYFEKGELMSLFSFSVWVLVIQLSQMFRLNLIPTILGVFTNTTEISVFSVAKSLEGMVYTISVALNGLFLPVVSRLVQSDNHKDLMELMIRVGRIQLFIISLILSAFYVFGDSFINLWIGEAFKGAYLVFIFLASTNIVALTLQIAMDMVYAENKIKQIALRVFFCSLTGLILSVMVAPKYGAVGCAAATGFALVLMQFFSVDLFHRQMGLDMNFFFRRCHLKVMPLILAYTLLMFLIRHLFIIDNWIILMFYVSIYCVGFCILTWFFLTNEYEKKLIIGIYQKKNNSK